MKEVRKARKEAFKSASVVLKLQETLRDTQKRLQVSKIDHATDVQKADQFEQEATDAKCALMALQQDLGKLREQFAVLEQEKEALKTNLKEEEVARIAAEGQIALPSGQDDDSDLGEEAPLTAAEAAEKAKRKKSLRFYTSQIAQKANKRGAAGRDAGGDEDVPHRERLRDRQARLNAEAEKRGRKPGGDGENADLDGNSDDEDAAQARHIRETADDDVNGYYDMVASKTQRKKSDKAAYAEAQKQAALLGGEVVQAETVGEDGKRKISYLIAKNKGLTPHRKKENRNSRVKKRKKYDDKKKKLASMKPVYKGGEGRGGYGGELTGIKKGLVKSTKL